MALPPATLTPERDAFAAAPTTGTMDPLTGKVFWTAGTLRYTKGGLLILFAWLLGNDLCLMLMEQVAPQLTPLLMKAQGATNSEIAFYITSMALAVGIWINPIVSVWSDRHRGPYGRRRPFLFCAAPICAALLCVIPFAPRIASAVGFSSTFGVILMIGFCYVAYCVFNSVITALFMYYFWDVVPEALLGRFSSLIKVVSITAIFLWNYFLFGLAEKHMAAVYCGVATFFIGFYLVSLWQVKEGEYPPPDPRPESNWLSSVRAYFVECYGHPYYLWVYAAVGCYQIGGLGSLTYQNFYLINTLHLSMDTVGKMRAWPGVLLVVLAYPLGVLVDRFKPVRMIAPTLLVWALVNLFCFFFLRGPWTLLLCSCLLGVSGFVYAVAYGVLNVEIFPREKLGQFCSATTVTFQVIFFFAAVPLGMFFDYIQDYRYTFLMGAVFDVISACLFLKVYSNWKKVGGRPPVPRSA